MGMFTSMNINATGLVAQRARLDVISNNIANANTTRTPEGGPFRRSRVILRSMNDRPTFKSAYLPKALENQMGTGVRVLKVEKDTAPGRMIYDPTHPDANFKGYVEMPNVNVVTEMADMIEATRSYEANVTLMNSSKQMYSRALDIGVR